MTAVIRGCVRHACAKDDTLKLQPVSSHLRGICYLVWVVEEKVVQHLLIHASERVRIPVRVKFEFEVKCAKFIPDTLSVKTLYNKPYLEKRYPRLDFTLLDMAIDKTVYAAIMRHLKEMGLLGT